MVSRGFFHSSSQTIDSDDFVCFSGSIVSMKHKLDKQTGKEES